MRGLGIWCSMVVDAVPPVALFMAFELLMSQVKSNVSRSGGSEQQPQWQVAADDPPLLTNGESNWKLPPPERQLRLLAASAYSSFPGVDEAATTFAVSPSTIRGDLRVLVNSGKIQRQGRNSFSVTGND